MKKRIANAVLALLVFVLPMAAQTYHICKVTSVQAGEKYVFEQSGRVMIPEIVNSGLNTTATFSTSGITDSEPYVWTLESAGSESFYIVSCDGNNSGRYIANTSSGTIRFSSNTTKWKFTFDEQGYALITNTTNSDRFLGYATGETYYKTYAQSSIDEYQHSITVYQLVEDAEKTLTGIEVTTLPAKTTYEEGESFNPEGMVVTATYTLANGTTTTEQVADFTYLTDGPLTADVRAITISYKGFSTTVAVTVNKSPQHTVTLGDTQTVLEYNEDGKTVTLPARESSETYTFVGWSERECSWGTTARPATVNEGTYFPSADVVLYPIFSMKQKGTTPGWELMTDLSKLETGTYALVTELSDGWHAFNGTISDKGMGGITDAFSFSNGFTAELPENAEQLTFTVSDDGIQIIRPSGTFFTADGTKLTGHLKWTSNSSNYWYLYSEDGETYLQYKYTILRYSTAQATPGFRTYDGPSSGIGVALAKKTESVTCYASLPHHISIGTYVTLYLEYDALIADGLEAFSVHATGTPGIVNLTALEGVIPAKTGVVLKASTAGTYPLLLSTSPANPVEDNILVGVSTDTEVGSLLDAYPGKSVYGLRLRDDGTPFFAKLVVDNDNEEHNTLAAHKALLVVESAAASIGLRNGDETAIDVPILPSEGQTSPKQTRYDLSGRPTTAADGLTIVNGKITYKR